MLDLKNGVGLKEACEHAMDAKYRSSRSAALDAMASAHLYGRCRGAWCRRSSCAWTAS